MSHEMIRVLCIEDNSLDRELIRHALEKEAEGFAIVEAVDRESFEMHMEKSEFDIVLTDFNILGFEGLEVIRTVMRQRREVPVIVVTGTGSEEVAVASLKEGADDYVIKTPRHIAHLPMTVKRVLESRRNREKVREMDLNLRAIVANSADGILVVNNEGTIVFSNDAAASMLGSPPGELTGRDFAYPIALADCVEIDLPKRVGGVGAAEMRVSETVWNKEVCRIVSLRDMTERLQLENRLRQSQKLEAIGTLAGGIAHDFNNILYAMLGYTEMAMESIPEKSDAKQMLENVLNGGERATELVRQILSFSRQTNVDRKPMRILPVVEDSLRLLRATIPSSIDIITHLDCEADTICTTPSEVHQILMNLCTNAVQAMEQETGLIEISLENTVFSYDELSSYSGLEPGEYVRFSVRDSGIGIPEEVIERVFDPFFTTKAPDEGTGLGLSVVHGIVEELKGNIAIESRVGKGTMFTILIPCVEANNPVNDVYVKDVPRGYGKLLLVDDEKTLVDMQGFMLAELGYDVVTRTSSLEALDEFKRSPDQYDLVITDLSMPQLKGDDLAEKLLRIRPDLTIILLTGYSTQELEDRVRKLGIRRMLIKPVSKQKLGRCLSDLMPIGQ